MKTLFYILIPFIGALIGWLTNYLAVKMLFNPKEPTKFLFVTFQGVFPKRQAIVAQKIGQLVADELLSSDEILQLIKHPENYQYIHHRLDTKLNQYFESTLPTKYPLLARLMPKKLAHRIQEEILEEIETQLPDLIQTQIHFLDQQLDIEKTIEQKVNALSNERLEKIIWAILEKEFVFIEWVGAFLGFVIGCIQVLIAILLQ